MTNGIQVTIKSDDIVTTFLPLFTTSDFKNKFSFGSGAAGFSVDVEAGGDDFLVVFNFNNPFLMRVEGSFTTDDFIKIEIRDDLSSGINEFEFIAKGFEKEP